jgi:glycosyltransferase involved in cell wall biosynthesis
MVTRTPRIAVVLPVYNGEDYLAEAIRSVLSQTFTDFELVVIDDGSTDRTADVLAGFSDARMRIIRFRHHRGLVQALNTGIRESRSELIARMDADDICLPHRFEKQVAFMDAHSDIALCGTWARLFGDARSVLRPAVEPKQIHARLFFGGAMDHPSIMMRRAVLERHGLAYDDTFRHVEDFDLFIRLAELAKLANLPEVLLRTRAHDREVSVVHRHEQLETEARLLVRQLRLLIPGVTKDEEVFHVKVAMRRLDASNLELAEQWLLHLERVNRESGRYDVGAFRHELRQTWYHLHAGVTPPRLRVLLSYWKSPLGSVRGIGLRAHAALIAGHPRTRLARWKRACRQWLQRRRTGATGR